MYHASPHPALSSKERFFKLVLATAPLAGQREIVACETLRRAWRDAGLPEQAMTHQWWRTLAKFAQAAPVDGAVLNLPGSVVARRPAVGVLAMTASRSS